MHPFAFIPYLAVAAAAAFVAISCVWDTNRSARGSMTEIFGCLFAWAFLNLCGQLESDPDAALFWLKLVHLPVLLLSVCVARLLMEVVPRSSNALAPLARLALIFAVVLGSLATVVPGVVVEATATEWGGWLPRYGIVSIAMILIGSVLPIVATHQALQVLRQSGDEARTDRLRFRAVMACAFVSIGGAVSTDYLLPLLQIPFPALGSLISIFASATMWLHLLHRSEDLTIAPQATARAVLSELHDGVALIDLSGTIRTTNPRLAGIIGCEANGLVGRPISDLIDTPLEVLWAGFEERRVRIQLASGARVSVSLTASCVRNRRGEANWVALVFRDLRSVDVLRRRLLSSGRLAAVGELAAGIAHEVNNPIAFIRSDLNFLRSRLAEIESQFDKGWVEGPKISFFEGGEAHIDAALEGIERVAQVVSDVREFAHVGSDGSASGDPRAIIASAVRLAWLEQRDKVTLDFVGGAGEEFMSVAAGQDFKQVILALLRVLTVNSRAGTTIKIDLVPDGALLRIEFLADGGIESAEEQIARFKRVGEDMLEASPEDLGLALAIELVDQLGGAVDVTLDPSRAFRIFLAWPFTPAEVDE